MANGGYDGEQLIDGSGRNKRRDKPDHTASSATPQATRHAPAQRNPVTVSLSISLARTVSTTMLAAVTGTAKLRSATDNSFMNAKKEIAMKKTASTSGPRWTTLLITRPHLPGRRSLAATACRFISELCRRSAI